MLDRRRAHHPRHRRGGVGQHARGDRVQAGDVGDRGHQRHVGAADVVARVAARPSSRPSASARRPAARASRRSRSRCCPTRPRRARRRCAPPRTGAPPAPPRPPPSRTRPRRGRSAKPTPGTISSRAMSGSDAVRRPAGARVGQQHRRRRPAAAASAGTPAPRPWCPGSRSAGRPRVAALYLPASLRTALITGAGTGIGASTALALAADGTRVALAGRRREPLEEIAAQLDGRGRDRRRHHHRRGAHRRRRPSTRSARCTSWSTTRA